MSDELGEFIKLARVGKGWPQDKLAEAAGISQASVSRIESGRQIDLDSLLAIFYALTASEGEG